MILEIEVNFTAGHFHGEEWPPSPARLFQALVAGSHRGAHGLMNQAVRDEALRWLERQEPLARQPGLAQQALLALRMQPPRASQLLEEPPLREPLRLASR